MIEILEASMLIIGTRRLNTALYDDINFVCLVLAIGM